LRTLSHGIFGCADGTGFVVGHRQCFDPRFSVIWNIELSEEVAATIGLELLFGNALDTIVDRHGAVCGHVIARDIEDSTCADCTIVSRNFWMRANLWKFTGNFETA